MSISLYLTPYIYSIYIILICKLGRPARNLLSFAGLALSTYELMVLDSEFKAQSSGFASCLGAGRGFKVKVFGFRV